MPLVKQLIIVPFFLCLTAVRSFAQNDAAKIVNDAYFECYGHIANNEALQKWIPFVQSHNATTAELVAEQVKLMKDSTALQKQIIKTAFTDAYGNAPQNETDSCFNSRVNSPSEVITYESLLNDLKNNLSADVTSRQLGAILRSYTDYFGTTPDTTDKNVKLWIDSAVANNGITYKVLMEQHRLYVVKTPEAQKNIINRAFNNVFGRDAKVAEMDSWFGGCRNGACSFIFLQNKLNEYKKVNPKPVTPVLAPQQLIIPVFTRTGSGTNEGCNCIGEKIYLVNADERNGYKVTIATYSYHSNAAATTEYLVGPKQEKTIGCTKDIECLYSIIYSVAACIRTN